MSLNIETLAAFSQAITEAMDKRMDRMEENMGNKVDSLKHDFTDFKKEQTETIQASIKNGMDEVMTTMVNRQDAFESQSDEKLKALENTMCERQTSSESRSDLRFERIENQLSTLTSTFPLLKSQQHPYSASLQPGTKRPYNGSPAGPPHPAQLPQPAFPSYQSENTGRTQPKPAHVFSDEQTTLIKSIVHDARTNYL